MSILLEKLTKRYGNHTVVNDVCLEIKDAELFVLLGASGSGKSTVLRMIAGLTRCDRGRILLHGRDVTHLAPQQRGTGFVFQNYSVFRHMTLAENIQFGLKIRKVPPKDRFRRCEELLDLVGLAGLGGRYPDQISGGQQQRVALARALAYEPGVLLLDEPLGALDVKIRAQLRRSLKEIQRRLRITTVLVTHDQEEAFELADRIGVIDRGVLLELGEPEQLYARPKTLFVAGFLGGGTVITGRVQEGRAHFGSLALPIPEAVPHEEAASVELLVRPEQVQLSPHEPRTAGLNLGKGTIIEQTFVGAQRRLRLRLPRLRGTRQIAPVPPFGEEGLLMDAVVPAEFPLPQQESWVQVSGWTILEQAAPRFLVIDPGSGPASTLVLANGLAAGLQGSVSVLGWAEREVPENFREILQRRMREAGLEDAELHVRWGELSHAVEVHRAGILFDMLLVPKQLRADRRDLDPFLVDLLEHPDLPVLVAGQTSITRIERILICTRAGEPGKSDIRFGGRLARALGIPVTLLHVAFQTGEPSPLVRHHLRQAAASLTALEVLNDVSIRTGDPVEEIAREAAAHHLVVVGGHGPQSRSFRGSDDVTLRVLEQAPCPVLVVPSEA